MPYIDLTAELIELVERLEPIARPGGRGRAMMIMGAGRQTGASTVAREFARIAAARSRRGVWLFDLDLGPVAPAFCAAGSKADQKLISEILASVGPEGFAPAWLSARGLHWAADLIGTEGEMPCAAE